MLYGFGQSELLPRAPPDARKRKKKPPSASQTLTQGNYTMLYYAML